MCLRNTLLCWQKSTYYLLLLPLVKKKIRHFFFYLDSFVEYLVTTKTSTERKNSEPGSHGMHDNNNKTMQMSDLHYFVDFVHSTIREVTLKESHLND